MRVALSTLMRASMTAPVVDVVNCNITQNSTVNGDGGGIAAFNGGVVTITNTTISGNQANFQTTLPFFGGGVFLGDPGPFPATISVVNSVISDNLAWTPDQVFFVQQGGGIYSFAGSVSIVGTTIANNRASSDGGGLHGSFTVDQASIISGNVSGGLGGGVFGVSSINKSSVTGNSAVYSGGAFYADGPGATISGSRIYGNTSMQGAAAVDGDSTVGATVTATNNWWGSGNSPSISVNPAVVTFSPWLVMTFAASPTSIYAGATSTLTASITSNSNTVSGFSAPNGTPATFTGTLGTVTPASGALTSGAATAIYTAGSTPGSSLLRQRHHR